MLCVFLWEQVVWVSEDLDTPEALRAVLHLLTADNFLVVSGDLVCDVPGGCSCSCTEATGSSSDSPIVASSPYSQFWNCIWWQDQATYRIWYYWPQFNASNLLYVSTGMQVSLLSVSQLVFIPLRCLGIVFFSVLRSLIGLEVCWSTLSFSMKSLLTLGLLCLHLRQKACTSI